MNNKADVIMTYEYKNLADICNYLEQKTSFFSNFSFNPIKWSNTLKQLVRTR